MSRTAVDVQTRISVQRWTEVTATFRARFSCPELEASRPDPCLHRGSILLLVRLGSHLPQPRLDRLAPRELAESTLASWLAAADRARSGAAASTKRKSGAPLRGCHLRLIARLDD